MADFLVKKTFNVERRYTFLLEQLPDQSIRLNINDWCVFKFVVGPDGNMRAKQYRSIPEDEGFALEGEGCLSVSYGADDDD